MKNLTKTLIAAAALACSAFAHAIPVTTWDATVVGSWVNAVGNAPVDNTGTKLTWGTNIGYGRSSLLVTNPGVANVNTYFGGGTPPASFITNTLKLTHDNNVIGAGTGLTSAGLNVAFSLQATDPLGALIPLADIIYQINFKETPNIGGTCVVPSPTPCNDIFVLVDGYLNETFNYGGTDYFINAFPVNGGSLSGLSDAACAAAGAGAGCMGFTTPENRATDLQFGLTISTARLEVPEPGSLALIGLAMTGLVAVRRRRAAAR